MIRICSFIFLLILSQRIEALSELDAGKKQEERLIGLIGEASFVDYVKQKKVHLEEMQRNNQDLNFHLNIGHGLLQVRTINQRIVSRFHEKLERFRTPISCYDQIIWFGNGLSFIDSNGKETEVLSKSSELSVDNYIIDVICDSTNYYIQFRSKIKIYNQQFDFVSTFDISPLVFSPGISKSGHDLFFTAHQNSIQSLLILDVSNINRPSLKKQFSQNLSEGYGFFADIGVTPDQLVYLETSTIRPSFDISQSDFEDHIYLFDRSFSDAKNVISFERMSTKIKVHRPLYQPKFQILASVNTDFIEKGTYDLKKDECIPFLCSIFPEKNFKYALLSFPDSTLTSKVNVTFLEMSHFLRATHKIEAINKEARLDPIVYSDDKRLYIYYRESGIQINDISSGKLIGFYPLKYPKFGL